MSQICIVRGSFGHWEFASGSEASFCLKINRRVDQEIYKLRDAHDFIAHVYRTKSWTPLPTRGSCGERILLRHGISRTYYEPWSGRLILVRRGIDVDSQNWMPDEHQAPELLVYSSRWLDNQLVAIWQAYWQNTPARIW